MASIQTRRSPPTFVTRAFPLTKITLPGFLINRPGEAAARGGGPDDARGRERRGGRAECAGGVF